MTTFIVTGGAVFIGSNFVRAVCMVAQEKGVPYENISAAPHSDEIKALNPLGQIPAMRHDGLDLVESTAIARYIDTAFDGPALIPTDPREAAPVNRWIGTVMVNSGVKCNTSRR
jgi:glutathione S-transferase